MPSSTSILEFPGLKRTRRYGAKVKTGCRTCKTRRIKCDEGKPACARCMSTGRKCDGYAYATGNPQALIYCQSPSFSMPVPSLSGLGDSVIYLEFYHYCASHTIASDFDNEFWSRIVLQMAQSEHAVRHAVIALGYLVKAESGNVKDARSVSMIDNRKTFLLHYNKAVRCLVNRMAEPSYPAETGLVTCLIFVCIEFLRCDYRAAFSHLLSGLKIVTEWRQRPRDALQGGLQAPSLNDAVTKRVSSPSLISGKIFPMFTRAMSTALLYGAPYEPILINYCPRPQELEDQAFSSILEAQITMHELRNATLIMISVMSRKLKAQVQPTEEDMRTYMHLLSCHESWFRALQLLERKESLSTQDGIVASSLKVSYYLTYIILASSTDFNQISVDAHISSFQALCHHAKIVIDSMELSKSSPSPSSATLSSSTPSPRGSQVSSMPSRIPREAVANFTFEISLIPPLFHASIYCRCPYTRRELVALLERNLPREALWDAKQHAMVARRVIEIEESELDPVTGWPAQRTRLAYALVSPDMDENGGFWVYFATAAWFMKDTRQRDPEAPRESEWREWFVM